MTTKPLKFEGAVDRLSILTIVNGEVSHGPWLQAGTPEFDSAVRAVQNHCNGARDESGLIGMSYMVPNPVKSLIYQDEGCEPVKIECKPHLITRLIYRLFGDTLPAEGHAVSQALD